ncbi:Putative thiosulfate sulfurtransferase [bacterium HR33]|nr:Putative thiosulfate sulfurtransferase [bacterium HR33]
MATEYANPKALVETAWVAEHLEDPKVRILEVDVDTSAYEQGHIPGAVGIHWKRDLETPVTRDIATKEQLEEVLSRAGVSNDSTVVLYGDNHNWFAAYAWWLLKYYGHEDVRIMNGGRKKWVEEGRPLVAEVPAPPRTAYRARRPDRSIRAFREDVLRAIGKKRFALVDVRSPKEFSGELLAPEHLPQEGAQRGGHVPGAQNIPWGENVNEDGTFKSAGELQQLYQSRGITPDKEIITYCRIGERSSIAWFALKELLGYPKVRNYDGSWTEYGSLVGVPIERGEAA